MDNNDIKTELEKELSEARKKIESLTKIKDQFDLLVSNMDDFVWLMNHRFEFTYVSPSIKKVLGYTEKEFLKMSILEIGTTETREVLKKAYDDRIKGVSDNSQKHWVTKHEHKNGNHVWIETFTTPVFNNGEFDGFIGVTRDITQQKISEQKIIESRANLESLIEYTDARIWSIDMNYNIISINSNFRNDFKSAFGVKLDKGAYSLENLPDHIFERWTGLYDRVLGGEQFSVIDEFEIENIPRYVEINFNPIKVQDNIIGATCYSRDITKQKISEQALLQSEQRYKSLVSNIPTVTYKCLFDKDWTMKFISAEIQNLTGYPPDDFIDNKVRTFTSIIHPDDREYVSLFENEKLDKKESFQLEYRIVHKNGQIVWVHERGRGKFGDDGKIDSIDGVISDISTRKKNEQDLQNSELRFRILSDASMDMMKLNTTEEILVYVSDILHKRLRHTIILANSIDESKMEAELVHISGLSGQVFKKALDIIGYSPVGHKFKIDKNFTEIFHRNKLTRFEKGLADFSTQQIPKGIANAIQKLLNINEIYTIGVKHQNQLFGAFHLFTMYGEKLEELSFIESFINLAGIVLQRQQLVEALHLSEEKFRSIFELTTSSISIQTADRVLLANKAFQNITGYKANEIKNLDPSTLIHPSDRDRVMERTRKMLDGEDVESNFVLHLLNKKSQEKWVDISASVINYEGHKATLLIANDITERKKAELQLNKFSTGIMNSPSSIVITDIKGTIEYVNPFFCDFTGYSFEEAVGENPRILNSGKNSKELYKDMWGTILKGEVWNGEIQNRKKNGDLYWEVARIAPIFDEKGKLTNFIAIKEDITERKRTLEKLEQSEKDLREINAKKDKFFSIIAHDLRSPFSGLAGLTDLLRSTIRELSNEQVDRYLELISQSTQNISKLLENLLSWAKTQTGKMEYKPDFLQISKIVKEAVDVATITAKNKDIKIESNASEINWVFADENMLKTVLRNLISNAIKYTHKGGKISVIGQKQEIDGVLYNVIGVKDNGVGIPKDKLDRIFSIEDSFSTYGTEKEKGTGLGLILCKEFVEKHKGKIWCESEENKGSTFSFSLPVVDKAN